MIFFSSSQAIDFQQLSANVGKPIEIKGFLVKEKEGSYILAEKPLKSCCYNAKDVPQIKIKGDFSRMALYRPHTFSGTLEKDEAGFFMIPNE